MIVGTLTPHLYQWIDQPIYTKHCILKLQKTLSSVHGTFSRMSHMLVHNTNLNKFKINIMSSFFQSKQYETRNQLQKETRKKTQTHGD